MSKIIDKLNQKAKEEFDFIPYQKCFVQGGLYSLQHMDENVIDNIINLYNQWHDTSKDVHYIDFIKNELPKIIND